MAGSGTMPTESGVDVPSHIREHLPEELSHLPADLLFATNLRVHEFSYSFAALRRVEERDSLDDYIRFLYGDDWIQWPRSAIDAARSAHDDYVRVRRMQEDALRWVHENRPTPAEAGEEAGKDADEEAGAEAGEDADEEAEEAGEDAGEALVCMIVDGSDEEAGAVDPRSFTAL